MNTVAPFPIASRAENSLATTDTGISHPSREEFAKLLQLNASLAEKNRELESIVHAAAHDLRSPLINIRGFADEIAYACETVRQHLASTVSPNSPSPEIRQCLDQEIPEAIGYIQTSVSKIDSLLSGFLHYARLGQLSLNIQVLDMTRLMHDVARAMDFEIKESGATVQISSLPACRGDFAQIDQVFSNLLSNALKYLDPSRPGQISISGTVSKNRAIYRVSDNGIGIDPENQSNIFEAVQRFHSSAAPGEGLGLSIARRIVQKHGGDISVESEPGKGSCFSVILPAPQIENENPEKQE